MRSTSGSRVTSPSVTRREFPPFARLACTSFLLVAAIIAAQQFGLVDLIAKGYRLLALLILLTFVLPLLTIGLWRLARNRPAAAATP